MEHTYSHKQFQEHSKKSILKSNQSLESLDLEGVLTLTEQSAKPLEFFHLDAESNLEISRIGFQNQTVGIPSDNTEYLEKIDKIRENRALPKKSSDLLNRGRYISIFDTQLKYKPVSANREITPLGEKKKLTLIEEIKSNIISEIQEQIDMADIDKDHLTEASPDLDDSSKSDDNDPSTLNITQEPGEPDLSVISQQVEFTTQLIPTLPTTSPSNVGIEHLYKDTYKEKSDSGPPSTGAILKQPVSIRAVTREERVKYIPRLRLDDDELTSPPTPVQQSQSTDMRSEIASGFEVIGTMISEVQIDQAKLLIIMESIVTKMDTLDNRLKDVELSMSVLKGVVGTLDADVKNLSIKQKTYMPSVPEQIVVPPLVSEDFPKIPTKMPTDKEKLKSLKASSHYQENMAHMNMKGLNEQVFVQAYLSGGIKSYFAMKYPNNHEVDIHLEAVDGGDAAEYHFLAIDRAILRLESGLHKKVYLPVDPTIPLYAGQGVTTSSATSVNVASSNKMPQDPKSLFSHIRTVYK